MNWDATIVVALLTVIGGIATAALSYFFTKQRELAAQWRENKINHYKVLLTAVSDLAGDNPGPDVHYRFALAVNTIAIVAPQPVVEAILAFHDEIKASNSQNRTQERHDELLGRLVLAIRADLGIRPKDDPTTFRYHLVGGPPKRDGASRHQTN